MSNEPDRTIRVEAGVYVVSVGQLEEEFLKVHGDGYGSVFEFLRVFIGEKKRPLLLCGDDGLTARLVEKPA